MKYCDLDVDEFKRTLNSCFRIVFLSANTYYHVQACDVAAAAAVVVAAANDSDSIDVVFVAATVF